MITLIAAFFFSCNKETTKEIQSKQEIILDKKGKETIYESENLVIRKISKNVYQHISYLFNNDLEMISCNGMIVVHKGKAIILDTPTNEQNSAELIKCVTNKMGCKIQAVVVTSFNTDCLGGLKSFHRNNIRSYASNETIMLAKKENLIEPQQGFNTTCTFTIGDKKVYLEHFEEKNNKGSIVGYFPDDQVIFGGRLIKENGLTLNNVQEVNTKIGVKTLQKIKSKYSGSKIVIPGHGESGGPELLDYMVAF